MVMKLRGLTRAAAIEALHLDKNRTGTECAITSRTTARDDSLITAEEFFSDIQEEEVMSAEEFFKS